MNTDYTIGMATYVYRFDRYFKPLITKLTQQNPLVPKIIFVNGQNDEPFNPQYRKNILNFLATMPNTYAIMSPVMRGFPFMLNTCFNFSTTPYMLAMGDDILIGPDFIKEFEEKFAQQKVIDDSSFLLNTHWGHVCYSKVDILERVGYLDERLLGFGEEDGDWEWQFERHYGRPIRSVPMTNIYWNTDNECNPGKGTKCWQDPHGANKYSKANYDFINNEKYEVVTPENIDPTRLTIQGLYREPRRMREGMINPNWYPGQKYYEQNKGKL